MNEPALWDRWKLSDIERQLRTLESTSRRILDRLPPERRSGDEVDARIADRMVPKIEQDVETLLLEIRSLRTSVDRLSDRPEPESTGCFRFMIGVLAIFILVLTIKVYRNVRTLVERPAAVGAASSGTSR
jgi:hypothetical protein